MRVHHLNRFFYKSIFLCSCILGIPACNTETPTKDTTPFTHSENVFSATDNWYVNRAWADNASAHGGDAIAKQSTAVWLRKIADIEEIPAGEIPNIPGLEDGDIPSQGMSLRDHLEAAEAQGNALVQLVLYGVPGRDCAAIASNGELPASGYGMEMYQKHYVDRIAGIVSEFPHVPLSVIVEPYTLTGLVKYSDDEPCKEVDNENPWGYTNGIRYAINTLSKSENVHLYLDIGASNNFGWDEDLSLITLFYHGVINGFDDVLYQEAQNLAESIEAADGATGRYEGIEQIFVEPPTLETGDSSGPGYDKIDGFVSNVANYVPLEEPYLGDPMLPETDAPLRSAYFYNWTQRIDELTYSQDWLARMQQLSPKETGHLGMLIDTSRNGWGQAHKVLEGSDISQDPELVNEFRIDQRGHRQNWCNQPSGIGKRPQADPNSKSWLDAYVWVKPPGESDGISDPNFEIDPNTPFSKGGWDPSCDPDALSWQGQNDESTQDLDLGTSAMPDAPRPNRWFAEGFAIYLENAWPPLCEGHNDQCKK